jgi:hypothetical protein
LFFLASILPFMKSILTKFRPVGMFNTIATANRVIKDLYQV